MFPKDKYSNIMPILTIFKNCSVLVAFLLPGLLIFNETLSPLKNNYFNEYIFICGAISVFQLFTSFLLGINLGLMKFSQGRKTVLFEEKPFPINLNNNNGKINKITNPNLNNAEIEIKFEHSLHIQDMDIEFEKNNNECPFSNRNSIIPIRIPTPTSRKSTKESHAEEEAVDFSGKPNQTIKINHGSQINYNSLNLNISRL